MEKRDPLRELGNTSDNNEPQEAEKEPKAVSAASDKENGVMTENSDPGKDGSGKFRRSFLKAFDPLYSEGLEESEVKLKPERIRQQLIIEDSDSDRSQVSPLPADVSDDDAAFVDATYIAAPDDDARDESVPSKNKHLELETSLIQFYTPEKFSKNTTLENIIDKSTSEPDSKESVLSEDKEHIPTSVSHRSVEDNLSYSAEEKVHSPASDISESKEFILPKKGSNEHDEKSVECVACDIKEKDESTATVAEANNADISDSNSEVSDIKTDSPDKSKEYSENEEQINEPLTEQLEAQNIDNKPLREHLEVEHVENTEKELAENSNKEIAESRDNDSSEKTLEVSKPDIEAPNEDKPKENLEIQTETASGQESVEKVPTESSDTVESNETNEGLTSSEKVPEELNKSSEIEKSETELSEKPVKSPEEKAESKQIPEEETVEHPTKVEVSGDEESVGTEPGNVEEKQSDELELLKDREAEDEANKTVDILQSTQLEEETPEEKLEYKESQSIQEECHKDKPDQETEEQTNKTLETHEVIDDSIEPTIESNNTLTVQQDEEQHLDSGVESIEESYTKSSKSSVDELEGGNVSGNKDYSNLPKDEVLEERKVELDSQASDDDSKTISESSIQSEHLLSETKAGVDTVESIESQEVPEPEKAEEEIKTTFDACFYKSKMADLSVKLSEQQQEISDLKLQLNASQQAKATLELEIRQKEEVIIKTQAEALKNEQIFKQEIKELREELKENSKLIEKDGSKELEEQLKEAKAKEAKVVAELNQRNKDILNYEKIMEEYENSIATHFADYQKLKEEYDTATRHLANIELAFSDVHQKYERAKSLLEGFRSNEETLSLNLQASEKVCKQHEERYESLKAHAKAQIEKSNKEILTLRDKYEIDINKLKAIIKRLEIKCSSLEVSLQQKTEECAALSALCEEVTGKRV